MIKAQKIMIMMIVAATAATVFAKKYDMLYKNPDAPIADRVEDLLGRMTLDEKVGQMNQYVGVEHFRRQYRLNQA
jgi:beta-glucosidase